MSAKRLIHGDCLEEMKNMADGSVDLTVTSPPYDDMRHYNGSLDWGERNDKYVKRYKYYKGESA